MFNNCFWCSLPLRHFHPCHSRFLPLQKISYTSHINFLLHKSRCIDIQWYSISILAGFFSSPQLTDWNYQNMFNCSSLFCSFRMWLSLPYCFGYCFVLHALTMIFSFIVSLFCSPAWFQTSLSLLKFPFLLFPEKCWHSYHGISVMHCGISYSEILLSHSTPIHKSEWKERHGFSDELHSVKNRNEDYERTIKGTPYCQVSKAKSDHYWGLNCQHCYKVILVLSTTVSSPYLSQSNSSGRNWRINLSNCVNSEWIFLRALGFCFCSELDVGLFLEILEPLNFLCAMSLRTERSHMKESLGEIILSNIQAVFITQQYHHILCLALCPLRWKEGRSNMRRKISLLPVLKIIILIKKK